MLGGRVEEATGGAVERAWEAVGAPGVSDSRAATGTHAACRFSAPNFTSGAGKRRWASRRVAAGQDAALLPGDRYFYPTSSSLFQPSQTHPPRLTAFSPG